MNGPSLIKQADTTMKWQTGILRKTLDISKQNKEVLQQAMQKNVVNRDLKTVKVDIYA